MAATATTNILMIYVRDKMHRASLALADFAE
jgi:hypothetical protein